MARATVRQIETETWLARAAADERFAWFSRGLSFRLVVTVGSRSSGLLIAAAPRRLTGAPLLNPDIVLSGSPDAWDEVFRSAPRPGYQSLGAWLRHDIGIKVEGEPLVLAQALAALERLVELARPPDMTPRPSPAERDPTAVAGRRAIVELGGARTCLLHWLEAGSGVPMLFLHTAGADARQYIHQLADIGLQADYRMLAFDMPLHGQSPGIDGIGAQGPYRLTAHDYQDCCAGFIEGVIDGPVIVVGCSMGAAMALTLTANRPDLIRGCIALEAPFRALGRRSDLLTDARIANGWHNPAYVRALLSPTAPQHFRDEACAIYAQAGPGIYMGDLAYYSEEYDGATITEKLRKSGRPVALLTGSYDYSASPDNTRQLAAAMGNASVRFKEMDGLGHFPMIEDPDRFRPYFLEALRYLTSCT